MARSVCAGVVGAALLLAGCADRLVEPPTNRGPAVPVALAKGRVQCLADTVLLDDHDPKSGAGAIPRDFDAATVLRCEVDYPTMRSQHGIDRFPVRQWQAAFTPQLRTALDLPDREMRPAQACAAAAGRTTAVYVVGPRRRALRVMLPTDDPCQRIRSEVVTLLPANGSSADLVFQVTRASR